MNDMNIPEFNWLPPEWNGGKPTLDDNVSSALDFSNPTHLRGRFNLGVRIDALKERFPDQINHVFGDRAIENTAEGDQSEPLGKVPHPDSDFSHADPGVYNEEDAEAFHNAVQALEGLEGQASKDGELGSAFGRALPSLRKVKELLGPSPKGLQRLKLVFENILCHVTALFGEMNAALDDSDKDAGKAAYRAARDEYMALLKDLDDGEPGAVTPGERGYGRMMKWFYIWPLIQGNRIVGAKVVAKWNPHISSSGIPVPHR